jgi:hypothetical protein
MSDNGITVLEAALETDFFARHPIEAASVLDKMNPAAIMTILGDHDTKVLTRVLETVSPAILPKVIADLPEDKVLDAINRVPPARVASIMRVLEPALRARLLAGLEACPREDALDRRHVVGHEFVEQHVDALRCRDLPAVANARAQQALDAVDPVFGEEPEVDVRPPDARAVREHRDGRADHTYRISVRDHDRRVRERREQRSELFEVLR